MIGHWIKCYYMSFISIFHVRMIIVVTFSSCHVWTGQPVMPIEPSSPHANDQFGGPVTSEIRPDAVGWDPGRPIPILEPLTEAARCSPAEPAGVGTRTLTDRPRPRHPCLPSAPPPRSLFRTVPLRITKRAKFLLGARSPAAIAANGDSTLAGTTWTSHVLLFMSLLFFRSPF